MNKFDLVVIYSIAAFLCFAYYNNSEKLVLVAGWIASTGAISKLFSMADSDKEEI